MRRSTAQVCAAVLALIAAFALLSTVTWAQTPAATPTAATSLTAKTFSSPGEVLLQTTDHTLPLAPDSVRMLRIRLAPGGNVPLHTHPGPEYGRVESGVLTVLVHGPAVITHGAPSGDKVQGTLAPDGKAVQLNPGDQIYYPVGTQMSFRNDGGQPAVILAGVILPIGHQHPPGIAYIDGTPGANDNGVSYEVLGDGLATTVPTGPATIVIDRLTLPAGGGLPAVPYPVMLSIESGTLDANIASGQVQLSTVTNPGLQPPAQLGTRYTLTEGDAAYFPLGMAAIGRPASSGPLALLRMQIVPDGTNATPAPAGDQQGVLLAVTPTPSPTSAVPPTPTATLPSTVPPAKPTTAPSGTAAAGGFQQGQIVVVTDNGVNLRSAPSTAGAVVETLAQGQQLVITGPSQTADNFTWWPVTDQSTGISGFVAGNFLKSQS